MALIALVLAGCGGNIGSSTTQLGATTTATEASATSNSAVPSSSTTTTSTGVSDEAALEVVTGYLDAWAAADWETARALSVGAAFDLADFLWRFSQTQKNLPPLQATWEVVQSLHASEPRDDGRIEIDGRVLVTGGFVTPVEDFVVRQQPSGEWAVESFSRFGEPIERLLHRGAGTADFQNEVLRVSLDYAFLDVRGSLDAYLVVLYTVEVAPGAEVSTLGLSAYFVSAESREEHGVDEVLNQLVGGAYEFPGGESTVAYGVWHGLTDAAGGGEVILSFFEANSWQVWNPSIVIPGFVGLGS